jgi:hypothetical protein
MSLPEKDNDPKDEFERLEEIQERTKAIQEAWRNLLKNLGRIEPEQTDNNEGPERTRS